MTTATTNVIAKIAAVLAGLGLVASSFAFAPAARAATVDELQAQINALLAQIATMQGGTTTSASATFTMDLTLGSSGAEVTALQNWLISKGYAIPAGATGYFGAQTQSALAAYQAANGISPAAGYFGPITRAKVNAAAGGTTGGSTGGTTGGGLSGGAGSVESYELMSFSNEEVGEDEEDVEIAGLEVEVDDGSDLELTAVRLNFDQGTADNDDLDEYISEVSIWLDGEEVARVDAEEFDEDNDYEQTISLDNGAVIEAGETGELTVAVSGVNNIDSNDDGETWTVDFDQIRFEDADGATISEDPTTGTETFSIELFAAAADVELNFSLTNGDEADMINEGKVIDVDNSDDTDNEEVLLFTVEVEGDSDIEVDEIPVLFTTTEAAGAHFDDPDDILTEACLWLDGEELDCQNFLTTDGNGDTETITFDELDLVLDAGEEYDFSVSVNVIGTDGVLDNGDTVQAQVTVASVEAEDESGEELAAGDLTGSASADALGFFDAGIMVELVSTDVEKEDGEQAVNSDSAIFTITFDVTAFDSDVYIDKTAPDATGGATESDLDITGAGTVLGSIDTTSGATEGTDGFLVEEDDTERFEVVVDIRDGGTDLVDGFFSVALTNILYALTDVDGDTVYAFNMEDFKTTQVFLDDRE